MKKKENMLYKTLWFTGFAGPAAICFVLVMLIPFIYGMYLTLTDWNGISAEKVFVGVENYKAIFRDGPFWHSLVLTVAYSAVSVILINFMAFVLAYLVTRCKRAKFLPCWFFYAEPDRRSGAGVYLAVYFCQGYGYGRAKFEIGRAHV